MTNAVSSHAFYALAAGVVVLDQVTKAWLRHALPLGDSTPLWPGVFHITHTRNYGAAFSLLQGRTALLALAALAVIGFIILAQRRMGARLPVSLALALALPLGGAVGNLIDRMRLGYVTDGFDFTLINFPVFNVADSAITVGIALLLWRTLFARGEPGHVIAAAASTTMPTTGTSPTAAEDAPAA